MYLVRFVSAAVAAAVLAFPGVAGAVSFGGTYGVSANGADPGLVVQVAPGAGVFGTPDLAVGGSHVFDVFRIWTDESSVNAGEDDVAKPVSVSFAFTAPGGFGGAASGATTGARILGGLFQEGRLTWDGPLVLNFGKGSTGQVTLALSDAIFNSGLFGLDKGARHGADVTATLTYDVAPVPAPAALPLLIGGIGLLGAAGRRRRAA